MRHQFVSLESVHTVRVQHTALIHLVLIWLTSSWKTDSRISRHVCRTTGEANSINAKMFGTSVLSLSTEQAPELCGTATVSVDALFKRCHLGGFTAEVPLSLNKWRHLRRLVNTDTHRMSADFALCNILSTHRLKTNTLAFSMTFANSPLHMKQYLGVIRRKQSPLLRDRADGSTKRTWTCLRPADEAAGLK